MRKAFVSYARANKADVDQLVVHLRELGCDTWVDSSLRGGQDWWQEILRRIAECDVFITVVSQDSLDSKACEREFDWAEALGKPVLPVAMERPSVALPARYSRRQIIDYSDPLERDRAAVRLGGGLYSLPPAPPLPRPAPRPPPAPLSYLTGLVDMVSTPRHLSHPQQRQVLVRLEAALRSLDPEERQGGRSVLDRFSSRTDLSPDVDRSVADLRQRFLEATRAPAPASPAASPAPLATTAPAPPATPSFPRGRLGGPATLLGFAALIGVVPPLIAWSSEYGYADPPDEGWFAVWYLQPFSWLLVGIAFGVLGSRAAAVKGSWAVLSAWLMAPAVVLYVVTAAVAITIRVLDNPSSDRDLYDKVEVVGPLGGIAIPALLGLMALLVVSFGLGVLAIKPVPWAVAMTIWGLCGIVHAYLAHEAAEGGSQMEAWKSADIMLIVSYAALFVVAVLMTAGSGKKS